ncbi:MAG: GtrA family protein, partial [Herbiconiux sp.]|nr:GtrA family protein [Herbiconiux sp.]
LLADNISGNVIGLALGSLFRFVMYRLWVFGPHRKSTRTQTVQAVRTAGAAPVAPVSVGTGSVSVVEP